MFHRLQLLAVLLLTPALSRAQTGFAGQWETTFGSMTLTQDGKKVTGFYLYDEGRSTIEGQVEGRKLTFTYQEPKAEGEGWFELSADGKSFSGKWRERFQKEWGEWKGTRVAAAPVGFGGVWKTSYGSMRLVEKDGRIIGMYGAGGLSTVEGKVEGKQFTFRYREPTVTGEAVFDLSADGKSFTGKWREDGKKDWAAWRGTRVEATPGRRWLVVLEANWEADLREQEYTFGAMLRAFFARSDKVQVRHRMFNDPATLTKWCREIAYIPEPVVLSIATHGTPQGATVDGKTIGAKALAEGLRHCDNIKLLHFSACLMMKDRLASEMIAALDSRVAFPISGYTTSVDWAASAIIEFMYFDLILMRNQGALEASEQMLKMIPLAGDKRIPGAPIPSAGFKILTPPATSASK
jgi:hypothetical protein